MQWLAVCHFCRERCQIFLSDGLKGPENVLLLGLSLSPRRPILAFVQSCTRLKLHTSQGALQVEKAVFAVAGGAAALSSELENEARCCLPGRDAEG